MGSRRVAAQRGGGFQSAAPSLRGAPSACHQTYPATVSSWVQGSRSSPSDLTSLDWIFSRYSGCPQPAAPPRPSTQPSPDVPWVRAQQEQRGAGSKAPGAEVTENSWTSPEPQALPVLADLHRLSPKAPSTGWEGDPLLHQGLAKAPGRAPLRSLPARSREARPAPAQSRARAQDSTPHKLQHGA